ncbi:MAG TPA: FtsX-like permease family protein [Thermoplasmata archaeon]|nr:FtsX-like permease family protein [Thermoplasmata archaeon]
MPVSSLVAGLLLILFVIGLVTIYLAARHRLAFRIAMRNVRRGRGRTVLLIAGLLVGTTIVSGSLIVGDTVQQLVYHYTYIGAGYVDESITGTSESGGLAYYPYSVYSQVSSAVAGYSSIAGVTPEIIDGAAVYDRSTGTPETALNLIGVNGNQSAALGTFVADNGSSIAGPLPGEVLLDDQTAGTLNASAGDTVVVYGLSAVQLTVQAVVQENIRGAFITGGLTPGNVFVTLATAQAIEKAPGMINYIAITNTGSQTAGASISSTVSAYLNTTLEGVLSANGLTVKTPLATGLSSAATSGESLLTLFLVLGLFSILAGAMLIVGIFVMLAEERKGEMGMLRAIGMRRRELVYTYYFEGVAYAAGSALAGTVVGVGVGYFLVILAGSILRSEGIPQSAIVQSFTVTGQSLVIAYVVGFILTLVTVVVACRRASQLNIVRAIRDIPEPKAPVRTYTFLAYLGGAMVVLGLLGFFGSYRGTGQLSYPIITGAFVILGAGLVAARFLKNRVVFTSVGIALVVWAGFEPLHAYLFGSSHSSSIFNLFVEGIILVGGVLMALLLNADALVALLRRLLGTRAQSSPVIRIGTDYPTRQPGRTAVSLTIFALVVFTMVATAGAGSTLQGSLNDSIATETGGYTFFGGSQVAMPNLWNQIQANATLAPQFSNAVPLVTGIVDLNVSGWTGKPYRDGLYSAPTNASGPASFYATNGFTFQSTLNGMSAAATFEDVATNASAAIVDESYSPVANPFTTTSSAHPTVHVGDPIHLSTPNGARSTTVTVVGILTESIITGVWLNPGTATSLGYTSESAYFLTLAPGASSSLASQDMKRAFFSTGLVLYDLPSLMAQSISTTEGFIGLLEIFVGLGLAVGIAAMGIFALRAVVERRRQIGMLRATGFTQGMVLRALFLEYSLVTVLGVVIGAGLGLLIIYNLSVSPEAVSDGVQHFVAPWLTVIEVGVIAYILVLVAIALPSLRAARLPPAEAVRTSE